VRVLDVVLPDGVDDPQRPSGGNVYDRRVCRGLEGSGWTLRVHTVPGPWPQAPAEARTALSEALRALPDGSVVLLDGLVASPAAPVLLPVAGRLRLVVLVHMPLGATTREEGIRAGERAVLRSAAAVVTTSRWSRRWVVQECALPGHRVHVAEPGCDPAAVTACREPGDRLLCVAALTPGKAHEVLISALEDLRDLAWCCVCVGAPGPDPRRVEALRHRARVAGIGDRVRFVGPRTGAALDASYAAADALVVASRFETYGMVVGEALARALPVLATSAGGLPEALGVLPDGRRPGLLVPPDDPAALSAAVRQWLCDSDLRRALRDAARARRTMLAGWDRTTERVSRVLAGVTS
jgi:glycosyltransferase involved in cell wall biosynthesis